MPYLNKKTGEILSDDSYNQKFGVSKQPITEQPKQPGILQSLAQGAIEPFAKTISTGASAARGVFNLGQAGVAALQGNKPEAMRQIQQASQPYNVNLGGLGKYKPIESTKEAITTGAKIASWAVPGSLGFIKGGAAIGGLYGGAEAVEQGHGPGGVALDTATGVLGGAIGGRILKGVLGKIPITKTAKNLFYKKAEESLVLKPSELSGKEYANQVIQGKFNPAGKVSRAKNVLTDTQKEVAKKYADLLQSPNPAKNAESIANRITEIDGGIESYLTQINQKISSQKLKQFLINKLSGVGEGTTLNIAKYKDQLVSNFVNDVSKRGDLLHNVFIERKIFDSGRKTYMDIFSGNPTLKKDIAKVFRDGIQDFISGEVQDGTYRAAMKSESELIRLISEDGPIFAKILAEKGKNGISLFFKNHPTLASLAKYGIMGVVLKNIFNINQTITPGDMVQ